MSKLQDSIDGLVNPILSGTLLAIDPSSGSKGSMPGYSIFKAGVFQDSGIIKIRLGTLHNRLYALREAFQNDFQDIKPDVLVIENIPPIMMNKGFFNKGIMALQKSIGVAISCFDCALVEVAPISWRKYIPEQYVKTDENDSLMMAITCLTIASQGKYVIEERVMKKLTANVWEKKNEQ